MFSNIVKRMITPGIQKFLYNAAGFNQYGLLRDDLLDEDNPDVKEALRRLPEDIRDERSFRIVRAMQLDTTKDILPKEQWTKLENDVLYLTPIVEEVAREREEKERWNADN